MFKFKADRITALASITMILGSTLAAFAYYSITKKKKEKYLSRDKSRDDNGCNIAAITQKGDSKEETITLPSSSDDLIPKFNEAAAVMSKMSGQLVLTQSDKLLLYGLYKQATSGERDEADINEPSSLNMVAWAKYDAWGKFKGITKEVAMMRYIEVAHHFVENDGSDGMYLSDAGMVDDDNADIVYSDEDEEDIDDGEGETTFVAYGWGLKPSTLNCDNDAEAKDLPEDATIGQKLMSQSLDSLAELQKFVDEGGDVNAGDDMGQTPLHFVADKGLADCAKLLLKHGADPNATDHDGISVLQTAVIGENIEVTRILLEAGADPDLRDKDEETPRICAEDGTDEMKSLFN